MDTKVGDLTIKDYGQGVPEDPMKARTYLEGRYGEVWDTKQLGEKFEVVGFAAPCAVVIRRADGKRGSVEFTHHPRFYFSFVPS